MKTSICLLPTEQGLIAASQSFNEMIIQLQNSLARKCEILNWNYSLEEAEKAQNIRRVLVDFGVLPKSAL